jgi:hypothetical protein
MAEILWLRFIMLYDIYTLKDIVESLNSDRSYIKWVMTFDYFSYLKEPLCFNTFLFKFSFDFFISVLVSFYLDI